MLVQQLFGYVMDAYYHQYCPICSWKIYTGAIISSEEEIKAGISLIVTSDMARHYSNQDQALEPSIDHTD